MRSLPSGGLAAAELCARSDGEPPVPFGRALRFLDRGFSLNGVARRVGCYTSSVLRWREMRRRKGKAVFKVGASPGRPLKLAAPERKHLLRMLLRGARAQGYPTDVWTCE